MTTSRNPEPIEASSQLDQEIADLLVFSVWELRQAANRAFEPLDLTTFHVAVLNFIANDPEVRSGDLAKRLGITHEVTSATISKLTERGLLKRITPKEDRRARKISLTEEGEALRLEANQLWRTVTVNRYAGISQIDKETFLRGLKAIHSISDGTSP